MELTVLGRYSPFPAPGGAMNGYLVQHESTRLLLDAGNGVAARLLERLPVELLTAVVVSHLHEDHIADVHCLRFAQMGAQQAGRTEAKLQVYAPTEPEARHTWLEGGEAWQDLHTYDPDQPLVLGGLEVRFFRTNHPIPCYAMRIKPVDADGPVLFYTADTGIHPPLVEAARGANLLLIEASLTEEYASKKAFGHLSGAEAAAFARDAGV
ncbi:MAG TPA: MBL fold metallo-hydrolase, partial [Symbiobacteriaceae bacterium]|nr:MBL fold metallo-hydrolase [Symbiobacteriaceae bacterium]